MLEILVLYADSIDWRLHQYSISVMLVSTLLKVALAGSYSLVAAELLNTAWLLNDGQPQGSLQNVSGGQSDSTSGSSSTMWIQLILPVPVSMYFARPADNSSARADKAVLVLPDIYGLAIPYALR